jgi:hypothetical protein
MLVRRILTMPRSALCAVAIRSGVKKADIAPYAGADLYVFRYKHLPDGTWVLGNSKPCAQCLKLIKKAKIKNVYYSVATYHSDGTFTTGIIRERAKNMTTDHISFGRRK